MPTCKFCKAFSAPCDSRSWFDRELHVDGDLVVVASLGPIVPGHLLILPRQHYQAMALLPEDHWQQLERMKQGVIKACAGVYGIRPVLFEHGTVNVLKRAGSSIDHAHLHVVPAELDLLEHIRNHVEMRQLPEFRALRRFGEEDASYLYFQDRHGFQYAGNASGLPSQFVRRLAAGWLGCQDEWDYTMFPKLDLVRDTIRHFTPWPPQSAKKREAGDRDGSLNRQTAAINLLRTGHRRA
ncbi:HIT domain-containing protein [Candidatus Bipolaricaulota bacterium]|nr:HIT domain-containing protein [Candidatus Bipolaricaulota bacterium]